MNCKTQTRFDVTTDTIESPQPCGIHRSSCSITAAVVCAEQPPDTSKRQVRGQCPEPVSQFQICATTIIRHGEIFWRCVESLEYKRSHVPLRDRTFHGRANNFTVYDPSVRPQTMENINNPKIQNYAKSKKEK